MYYPSSISPSPVQCAFSSIEWTVPLSLSSPEIALLQSVEENPLEYTIAEYMEAFQYARLLLKLLDQVMGPTQPGILSKIGLDQIPFEQEQAMDYLEKDKTGVVTHFVMTKLFDLIHILSQDPTDKVKLTTIFFANQQLIDDWRPLLQILYRQGDAFAQRNAALCISYLLRAGCEEKHWNMEDDLQALISWLTSRLQSSHSTDSLSVVTPTLCVLGGCPLARVILDQQGGIGYTSRHLRLFCLPKEKQNQRKYNIPTIQQVYEMCFCVWTMSFDLLSQNNKNNENESSLSSSSSMQQSFVRGGIIPALCQLLALAPREKVIRLCLATLRNLTLVEASSSSEQQHHYRETYLNEMVACHAPQCIEQLLGRTNWSDDSECLEDLLALQKALNRHTLTLTQWKVYQAELESGQLSWGILHTEDFFRQHIRQMEGPKGDFEPVKKLLSLLMQNMHTDDDESLAICLFDIGEFIWQYPNGRAIAKRLGIREIVLQLLDHPSTTVQTHALQCMSKLLIQHNWRSTTTAVVSPLAKNN
mmetsp:Transcript_12013/g.28730  ORF Transcript_12013/g.28730 Transcript_12013/m.28730 type:complete len:531 (+) Transcript_12013:31-1623(+)